MWIEAIFKPIQDYYRVIMIMHVVNRFDQIDRKIAIKKPIQQEKGHDLHCPPNQTQHVMHVPNNDAVFVAAKVQQHSVDLTCEHRPIKQVDPRAIQLKFILTIAVQGIEWPAQGLWTGGQALSSLPLKSWTVRACLSFAARCLTAGSLLGKEPASHTRELATPRQTNRPGALLWAAWNRWVDTVRSSQICLLPQASQAGFPESALQRRGILHHSGLSRSDCGLLSDACPLFIDLCLAIRLAGFQDEARQKLLTLPQRVRKVSSSGFSHVSVNAQGIDTFNRSS